MKYVESVQYVRHSFSTVIQNRHLYHVRNFRTLFLVFHPFFTFLISPFSLMLSSSCSFATCILHTAHSVSRSCSFVCSLWLYGLLFVLVLGVLQLAVGPLWESSSQRPQFVSFMTMRHPLSYCLRDPYFF